MIIFRDIEDVRNLTQKEKEDGKNAYGTEEVLQFIRFNGTNLINNSDNQKTTALELLEVIYPDLRTDDKVLEALFEVGGKKLFEEIAIYTDLLDNKNTKLKVYYGAIKGINRRIEELDAKIDEEKMKKGKPEIIEELETLLQQEEKWKNDLITQKREIVASIIEKQSDNEKANSNGAVEKEKEEYDEEGYNKRGYNIEGFDRQGFNEKGIHRETGTRYNPEGYNQYGFDRYGYDKEGYDQLGQDKEGYDRDGFDGFNYNKAGFNRDGSYDKIFDRTRKEKELEELINSNKKLDDILLEFEELKKMEQNRE